MRYICDALDPLTMDFQLHSICYSMIYVQITIKTDIKFRLINAFVIIFSATRCAFTCVQMLQLSICFITSLENRKLCFQQRWYVCLCVKNITDITQKLNYEPIAILKK